MILFIVTSHCQIQSTKIQNKSTQAKGGTGRDVANAGNTGNAAAASGGSGTHMVEISTGGLDQAEMAETLTVVTAEAYLSATHYIQLE